MFIIILHVLGQDIQVRIHGGKGSYEGNVDIFKGNKWYPVCKDGFSMSAAKVVCRTLGFPDRLFLLFLSKEFNIDYTNRFMKYIFVTV